MSDFRAVAEVRKIIGPAPLLVAVDEWLANQWAVYFLREQPTYLVAYRMYMADGVPEMRRARVPPLEEVAWVLTDAGGDAWRTEDGDWRLVWSGGPYRLWSVTPGRWLMLTDTRNPNGTEAVDGQPFFWAGQGKTLWQALAGGPGELTLSARFRPGPSLPETPVRHVRVGTEDGRSWEWTTEGGPGSITVPVRAGPTTVSLQALDRPTVSAFPNGDRRPLLLGVEGLRTRFNPAPTSVGSGAESRPGT